MTTLRSARWIVCAVLVVALAGVGCSKAPVDEGRYYRVKVGLTYKGEPVDIDFVAGCNVHNGRDISGSSIHEISGMTDLFRGVRMPEGHAVVINTYPWFENPRFSPCDGDTTDESRIRQADPRLPTTRVPKDWLPFIQWFEHDDNFAHGVGYLTQDAYENKNARFGFRYARIEHATKAEFETFRKTGPANLLPLYQTDWTQGPEDPFYRKAQDVPESVRADPPSGWRRSQGRTCMGMLRWRPTEDQRWHLRVAWPGAWEKKRPTYWTPDDWKARLGLALKITPNDTSYAINASAGLSLTHFRVPYTDEMRAQQPQFFPISSNRSLTNLNPKTSLDWEENALIGDGVANLGFVFCDVFDWATMEAVIAINVPGICRLKIDGVSVPSNVTCKDGLPVFERGEFMLNIFKDIRS